MFRSGIVTVAALAAFAGSASADLSMRFIEKGEGRNVKLTLDGQSTNVFAGQLIHQVDWATGCAESLANQLITTFCTEIEQNTSSAFTTYTCNILGPVEVPAANAFSAARTQAVLNAAALHYETVTGPGATQDQAAAFQILLWEIIYDFDPNVGMSSIDPTSGNLVVTRTNGNALWSAVDSLVTSFADAVGTTSISGDFLLLTSPGKQDQLVVIPSPGVVALLGLAGMVGLRRRTR